MCSLKKILTGLFFVTFFSCILLAPALVLAATDTSRSIKVQLKTDDGEIDDVVTLYGDSYALLIGSSNYYNGWEPLESIPSEISQVESLLKEKGFKVTTLMDPDSNQLSAGFENFINAYGLEKENRLLFFFSGHGFTRNDGKKGYLVPVDAPDPNKDMQGFVRKAIDMSQMMTWAKKIEAKHALFLFDSCFSGTIFKQRSNQKIPKLITRLTILPVRQFITAGSAGEEVPAKSTFTPLFIDALRYGYADLNGDGYIRARELGMYLQNNVPKTADQFPQYGPINDYDLAQGDFIFLTGKKAGTTYTTPETQDRPQDTAQKTYPNSNGILKVQSIPAGAAVYVGNRFQGTTPVTLSDIQPGAHQLRVEKNGYMTQKKQIEVYAGTMTEVEFPLIDTTAGGTLTVETNPNNASIKIADYPGSYTPGMRMPAAYYDLEISKYGYIPESITIELGESEDLHLNVTLKSETSFVRI